jgi:hypothetical protein
MGVGVALFASWSRRPIRKARVEYESIAMVEVLHEEEDEEG